MYNLVYSTDTDRDGLSDELEGIWRTDPNNPDTEGDGLTDGQEVSLCAGLQDRPNATTLELTGKNVIAPACANPHKSDTDGDGLTDFQEVRHLATSANSEDSDGDGLWTWSKCRVL